MTEKKRLTGQMFAGERALFGEKSLYIEDSIFHDGESPLKESEDIELLGCMFKWKYPLWYAKDVSVKNSTWFEMARAGVWYTKNVGLENCLIEAPKNFRRCESVKLKNVSFSNAAETLWKCSGVKMEDVVVTRGDYFGMDSSDVEAERLTLYGNYAFDGSKNVTVRDSRLLTKDAFWNAENITVEGAFISGEYLGWNSKNLVFRNCTIESLQGLCYIDNLVMENCRLLNTTLALEYSSVEADIRGDIASVFNPSSGHITADEIGKLIVEKDRVDPSKTVIVCRGKEN